MFGDLRRAFDHLFDPEFRWLLASGVAVALAMLCVLTICVYWGASFVQDLGLVGFAGSINQFLSSNILATMFGLSVVLMVPIAAILLGLFRDTVADEVERTYFPQLAAEGDADIDRPPGANLKFLALLLLCNIFVGNVYVGSPILALVLFWTVNGWLLGREYFRQIALRRLDTTSMRVLRYQNWASIWGAGTFMTICLTVPVFNLFVPILSLAAFTQSVNRLSPQNDSFMSKLRPQSGQKPRSAEPLKPDHTPLPIKLPSLRKTDLVPIHAAGKIQAHDPDDMTTWANIFTDLPAKR